MRETVIGVIGGMGPAATAQFYSDFVAATPAKQDQDHYHVIIDSNVKTPDRTGFVYGDGLSPLPEMVKSAKRLANAGATVGCIPCMTAHYFYDDLVKQIDYPIIHAMATVAEYIDKQFPNIKRVGILCTDGTRKMRLFDKHLSSVEAIYPTDEVQKKVMQAIYGENGIKAGYTVGEPCQLLTSAADSLIARGAQLIIAGCTEVPLALKQAHVSVPYINALSTVIDKLLTYR